MDAYPTYYHLLPLTTDSFPPQRKRGKIYLHHVKFTPRDLMVIIITISLEFKLSKSVESCMNADLMNESLVSFNE